MRRFEFVEGSSAKFWSAGVEGSTFVVVYGRIGAAGQRKDKAFPTEEAAQTELAKKIAEKLKEGYTEVGEGGAPPAEAAPKPSGKGAPRPLPPLPPRVTPRSPAPDLVLAAVEALSSLESEVGARSWMVRAKVRRARRALERLGGYDPTGDQAMAPVFESLLALVIAPRGARRLSLRNALELLVELDARAFTRALEVWSKVSPDAPSAAAVGALVAESRALEDPELALRLGALLSERPDHGGYPEAGWARRWKALAPHLDAQLARGGGSLKAWVKTLEPGADAQLKQRLAKLKVA